MQLETVKRVHCSIDVSILVAALIASGAVFFLHRTDVKFIIIGSLLFTLVMHLIWTRCNGCPITHLENRLRIEVGEQPYSEDGCVTDCLRSWLGQWVSPAMGKFVSYAVLLAPAFVGSIRLFIF
ncbi:hypothetical protein C4568_02130 [Candidatus Parcubacteria bacterium]|nr:MAG: hypothetical protein C4568_02130 [Candidatus Parcubacteria bacterium]